MHTYTTEHSGKGSMREAATLGVTFWISVVSTVGTVKALPESLMVAMWGTLYLYAYSDTADDISSPVETYRNSSMIRHCMIHRSRHLLSLTWVLVYAIRLHRRPPWTERGRSVHGNSIKMGNTSWSGLRKRTLNATSTYSDFLQWRTPQSG